MNHIAEIQAIKETNKGTWMKVFVPDSFLETNIERYKKDGKAYVGIKLDDNRTISAQQRKMYFASLKDISDHTGHLTEWLHDYFKLIYKCKHEDINVSMSDCTVSQANKIIDILIEFIITRDIPLSDLGISRTGNTNKYLYLCIANRKCCCCGKLGRVYRSSSKAISLCSIHYDEMSKLGEKDFNNKHKVYGLELDDYAIKKLGI